MVTLSIYFKGKTPLVSISNRWVDLWPKAVTLVNPFTVGHYIKAVTNGSLFVLSLDMRKSRLRDQTPELWRPRVQGWWP